MDILICINKILPNWCGAVWSNSYEGIKPDISEKRKTPSLVELEAVWPEVEAEQLAQAESYKAKEELIEIDLKSIRDIREWVAKQADSSERLKEFEVEAVEKRKGAI